MSIIILLTDQLYLHVLGIRLTQQKGLRYYYGICRKRRCGRRLPVFTSCGVHHAAVECYATRSPEKIIEYPPSRARRSISS